jgi:hypothetical protein
LAFWHLFSEQKIPGSDKCSGNRRKIKTEKNGYDGDDAHQLNQGNAGVRKIEASFHSRPKMRTRLTQQPLLQRDARRTRRPSFVIWNFGDSFMLIGLIQSNSGLVWKGSKRPELSLEQKQQLQKVLFPGELIFANGEFGREGKIKFGDPTGNRTRATSVKGRCPNR